MQIVSSFLVLPPSPRGPQQVDLQILVSWPKRLDIENQAWRLAAGAGRRRQQVGKRLTEPGDGLT